MNEPTPLSLTEPCSCWWAPVLLHDGHCCFRDDTIDYENDYCRHDGWHLGAGDTEGTFMIHRVST